jgi:GH24 family phage-related lysozyme (muramidase)
MSRQAFVQVKQASSPALLRAPLLQRKCACGNHTIAGAECTECGKNNENLQREHGNQNVSGAAFPLSGVPVMQAKLAVGASIDPLELEADRIADQVLAAPANPAFGKAPLRIQRFTGQSTAHTDMAPGSVDRVLAGPGSRLTPPLQQDMEQRFGHDFSHVRVHSGSAAEQSARDVNAHAYTVGNNIVFGAGRLAPGSPDGRRLIAHELTHVVQQTGLDGSRIGHRDQKLDRSPISPQSAYRAFRLPAHRAQMKSVDGIVIQKKGCELPCTDVGAAAIGPVPQEVIDHIKLREGCCEKVYEDSRGLLTAGIGHLLTDKEKTQYKEGDTVPLATRAAWVQADLKKAYDAGAAQASQLGISDQNFINAMASVNFQLGPAWKNEHKKTWAYMVAHEWDKAATEAQDSKWYKQTPVRVQDFQAALRGLSSTSMTTPTTNTGTAPAGSSSTYEFKIGAPIGQGSVTVTSLNIRKGPGTSYARTGTNLEKGALVTIYGQVAGWDCIGSGQWVSSQFISDGKKETGKTKQQRTTTANDLLAMYATYLPYTSIYANLDECGLARLLTNYARFEGKLVIDVFDALYDSDTDDVAYAMVRSTSDKDLVTFDCAVLARLKIAMMTGWQTDEELTQIARINRISTKGSSGVEKDTGEAVKPTTSKAAKTVGSEGRQKPDLVFFRGFDVARSIEPKLEAMVLAAEKAGITLKGGGARTYEEQVALRKANCGATHYDIYEKPSNLCAPPTAIPGRSMHERGLAFDFQRDGKRITKRDPEYIWLAANAERFGFYNLPSENWHWSTTGG